MTIAILGLDRIEHGPRDKLYVALREARDMIIRFHGDPHPAAVKTVTDNRTFLAKAVLPSSPFSAMAAAYVAANPIPA